MQPTLRVQNEKQFNKCWTDLKLRQSRLAGEALRGTYHKKLAGASEEYDVDDLDPDARQKDKAKIEKESREHRRRMMRIREASALGRLGNTVVRNFSLG